MGMIYMGAKNMLIRYEHTSGGWKKVRSALCSAILLLTLMVIVFLAVPVCLLTGLIGMVWSVGDRILSWLSPGL